jgi:hypothetical protein
MAKLLRRIFWDVLVYHRQMDMLCRTAWDLFFLIVMLIVVISVPFLVGFSVDHAYGTTWTGLDIFMFVIDASFVYDMYMQTRYAHHFLLLPL